MLTERIESRFDKRPAEFSYRNLRFQFAFHCIAKRLNYRRSWNFHIYPLTWVTSSIWNGINLLLYIFKNIIVISTFSHLTSLESFSSFTSSSSSSIYIQTEINFPFAFVDSLVWFQFEDEMKWNSSNFISFNFYQMFIVNNRRWRLLWE